MAIKYMERVTIGGYDARIDKFGFEYEESLSDPGAGDVIIIPDSVNNISVTLEVVSGSGKVQTTTNKVQDVLDNNNVVWDDWDSGEVANTIQDAVVPVTAIRMVNTSGEQRILIRAQ
jgi:hypothetical protein